jgi:hypothetical protein
MGILAAVTERAEQNLSDQFYATCLGISFGDVAEEKVAVDCYNFPVFQLFLCPLGYCYCCWCSGHMAPKSWDKHGFLLSRTRAGGSVAHGGARVMPSLCTFRGAHSGLEECFDAEHSSPQGCFALA